MNSIGQVKGSAILLIALSQIVSAHAQSDLNTLNVLNSKVKRSKQISF